MTDKTQQNERNNREETISDLDVPAGQAESVRGGLKADSNEVAVEGIKAGASEVLYETVAKPPKAGSS